MVNKVTLIGNLGADPETRTANSGTAICNLRVATTARVKKGESWEDETEWHRVVCFGKTAENAARFLTKGRQVFVEGRIRTNKWQDKDGNDRYTTEILANEVRFLGGKPEGAEGGPAARTPQHQTRQASRGGGAPAASSAYDEDIPF